MATEYRPDIEETDYEAVRALVPELPKAYADWLQMEEEEVRIRKRKGEQIVKIPVDPKDFDAFLNQRGQDRATEEDLYAYVRELGEKIRLAAAANQYEDGLD